MKNPPPRRRNAKPENTKRMPRDNISPRRKRVRPSIRDRLPRRIPIKSTSIKSSKNSSLSSRCLKLSKRERTPTSTTLQRRKDDVPKTKIGRLRDRDLLKDLRPLRDIDFPEFNDVPFERNGGSKKLPNRPDLFPLDHMNDFNDKYRTSQRDILPMRKEPRIDKRDMRNQGELFSRKSLKERHDKFRDESPPRKYQEFDKYEKRFRELSPFRKNETFDNFRNNSSSFSNSRVEKFDKYFHGNQPSKRSDYMEKPRKYNEDLFLLKDPPHPLKYKDLSPPRRNIEKRKDWANRLGPIPEKHLRHESPPKRLLERHDRHFNDELYPRRRDPEERHIRNELSPDRSRRKYESPMGRPPPFMDRQVKYDHNNLSPRRNYIDKYDSPPPPPPPFPPTRKLADKYRRPLDLSPREKPPLERRRIHESPPRRNTHLKRHEKYSDLSPPREMIYAEKRDKYSQLPLHGEHSRSQRVHSLPTKRDVYPDRSEKFDHMRKVAPLDKRDKRLAELAHSKKLEISKRDISLDKPRSSRSEKIDEFLHNREEKRSRDLLSTAKKKRFDDSDRDSKRKRERTPPLRKRIRDNHREINNDSRDSSFRKSRVKSERNEFEEKWISTGGRVL